MTSDEHRAHSERVSPAHSRTDESRPDESGDIMSDARTLSRGASLDHYANKRQKRNRRLILRSVIIAFAALVVVGITIAFAYINDINTKLGAGVTEELLATLSERTIPDDPFYMLLLGVDKGEERTEEYGEEYWNYRADTIILARIDPKDVKVALVSIPRDTYVDMHENGQTKINAAYSYGGPSYMVQVVEEFAGVDISHYAEFDFDGFIAIVDQIGGIDVNLPVPVKDPDYTGLDLAAGEHHLNGWDALMLCRSRHAYDDYGGGDFYRAANQRMAISAVARRVLASDLITMTTTVSTLASYTTTDMTVEDIVSLALQMKDLDIDNNFYSGQVPTISTFYDELWYEICDTEAWQRMMRRTDAGMPPYSDEGEDFTAGIAGSISQNTANAGTTDSSVIDGVEPTMEGSVLVLNAAAVDGLAGEYADRLNGAGFAATAENANSIRGSNLIVYNGDANLSKARGVFDTIEGNAGVMANDGSYSNEFDVVLVLGADNRAASDGEEYVEEAPAEDYGYTEDYGYAADYGYTEDYGYYDGYYYGE